MKAAAVGIIAALVHLLALLGPADAACLPNAVPPENRANIEGLNGASSVPFGLWSFAWDSGMLVTCVVKILAGEVLGYNTTVSGVGSSAASGLYATAGCRAPNDFTSDAKCSGSPAFVHHAALEIWGEGMITTMREALASWPEVIPEDAGGIGYEGIDGAYIFSRQRQEAYDREGLALEYYRSYDARWNRPMAYFDNFTAFAPAELKACNESVFTHSAAMQDYVRVSGDHAGVLRAPDGSLSARCWYDSWWFSPACRGSPELCVPFVTGGNGWSLDDMMQRAAVFGMPLAIAVAKTTPLWRSASAERRCLPYWWQPDPSFLEFSPSIVQFPPHDAMERARNVLTSSAASIRLSKWVHKDLQQRAPRLRELVFGVSFTMRSITEMLAEVKGRGFSEHEEVACRWVRSNQHLWNQWVPVETQCVLGKGLVGKDVRVFEESRANASECRWCSPGRSSVQLVDTLGKTHVCAKCQPGRSQPSPGSAECSACDAGTFADVYESDKCQHCDFGKYVGRAGQSSCDACPPGFITNFRGATSVEECICPEGSYLGRDRRDACLPCEEGMLCPEGSDILGYSQNHTARHRAVPLLKPGYWSSREEPLSVFRCEDSVRCPGGAVPGQACAETFELLSCAACEAGLVLSRNRCTPCAVGFAQMVLFPILPLSAAMLVIAGLYRFSGQPYTKWGSWQKGAATSFFIMLNYYHVVSIIHVSSDAISDGESASVFESVEVLSDLLSIFRPQCSGLRSFMSQLVLQSHGPGVLLLVFVAIWVSSWLLSKCHQALGMEWNRLLNTYFSIILTFFTHVVDMAFTIFKCTNNPNGKYTLVRDRSIVCFEGEWNGLAVIGVLAVLLWCFGYGAVLVQWIYAAPQRFHETTFQTRCAFLFVRYRPDVHWWALVVVAKGVFLNLGSLFIRSGVGQIYWVLVVCLVYTYLTVTFRPWRHLLNNSVDTFAHLSLCLTTATSMWLAAAGASTASVEASSSGEMGVIRHLLSANLAAAALFLIPVTVGMWWREGSQSAQDQKDTDARLFLSTLEHMASGDYHELLEFLKLLTDHDFQLICKTKDMLLMEQCCKKVRSGYGTQYLTRLSMQSMERRRATRRPDSLGHQTSMTSAASVNSSANHAVSFTPRSVNHGFSFDSRSSGGFATSSRNISDFVGDNSEELSTFSI